jgi:hypothetical protein
MVMQLGMVMQKLQLVVMQQVQLMVMQQVQLMVQQQLVVQQVHKCSRWTLHLSSVTELCCKRGYGLRLLFIQ